MNVINTRKLNQFQRESIFLGENGVDFPEASPGGRLILAFNEEIALIQSLDAQQVSGFDNKNQSHGIKDRRVDELREIVRQINLAAHVMSSEVEGAEDKFRLPRKPREQSLLATARSFLADAVPLKAKFIEYGLAPNFLERLESVIDGFQLGQASVNNALELHGEATGALKAAFRRAAALSDQLDSLVKLKYRENPAKLAAWKIASHLERAPKREKKEPPAAG